MIGELLLLILTPLFQTELDTAENETSFENLTLVMNEDKSVNLIANNSITLAGFDNVPALYGPNGVNDILAKLGDWA